MAWISAGAGLLGMGIGALLVSGQDHTAPKPRRSPADVTQERRVPKTSADPVAAVAPSSPAAPAKTVRIAPHERMSLRREDLLDGGTLPLVLDLPSELQRDGGNDVRLVALDGRVLDLKARPRTGDDAGMDLEIDSDFLTPGRYLLVVDVVDTHPIGVRRFVLEVH